MRARRKWILLLIGLIIVGTVVWNLTREREPVYEGKRLSEWLLSERNIQSKAPSEWVIDEKGVLQIGTNAIPFLLKWISYEQPIWREKAAVMAAKLPAPLSSDTLVSGIYGARSLELGLAAVDAFKLLGPIAAPAIPELIRLGTNASSERIRYNAIRALVGIGSEATPTLLAAYANGGNQTRGMISVSIVRSWTNEPDHGFITNFFVHPDALVRQGATNFALDNAPGLLTNAPPR